jgi:uncharacterized paraquat-inducible protein A
MQAAPSTPSHSREGQAPVIGAIATQREIVVRIRCPKCNKMLAKCSVRGMIEIACPRCKALVRNIFP